VNAINFLWPELNNISLDDMFQQDGATYRWNDDFIAIKV